LGVISSAFGGDLLAFVLVIPPGFLFCSLMLLLDSLPIEGVFLFLLLSSMFGPFGLTGRRLPAFVLGLSRTSGC
jgi:hypothetical protein